MRNCIPPETKEDPGTVRAPGSSQFRRTRLTPFSWSPAPQRSRRAARQPAAYTWYPSSDSPSGIRARTPHWTHESDRWPGASRLVHRTGGVGAALLADAAQDASVNVVDHMALETRGRGFRLDGVLSVSGFLNRPPEGHFSQLEASHRPSYLSVQLMQGSMVSTIMLTSARSHPASAVAMPARFCDVGVRMRMRSRNFDPLPRA